METSATFAILTTLSGLLYMASFAFGIAGALAGKNKPETIFAYLGFTAHTLALSVPIFSKGRIPLENAFETLECAAWFFVAFEMAWRLAFKVRFLGVFSMLPAFALVLLPSFCPIFWSEGAQSSKMGSFLSAWHGILATASIALTFLSAVFAPMYLIQQNSLSKKTHWGFATKLPSLDTSARCIKISLALAALFMGISAILGIVAATEIAIDPQKTIKFSCALTLLLLQTSLAASLWKGKIGMNTGAKLSVALAAVSLVALAPIFIGTF